MSYILEALKKADAAREREREAVPGLHSRHDHALPDESDERAEAAPAARTPWLVGGIAGGVVIAGALFWLLGRSGPGAPLAGETRPMPLHGQVGEAPPAPGGLAQAPSPVPPTQGAYPAHPPGQGAAPPPAPAPVAAPIAPSPAPPHANVATPRQAAPVQTPVAPPASQQAVPAAATAPAPIANTRPASPAPDPLRVDPALREPAPKVMTVQELPDNIRRELPQLTVGGAMHSDVASNRMLVLNGGVFREGDQPTPGVVLEEIRLKSAVLRYKGYRYSISY